MQKNHMCGVCALLICIVMLSLVGCDGGASGMSSTFCTNCMVLGAVSGLNWKESVTLLNNGGDALSVITDGSFRFSTGLARAWPTTLP